MSDLSKRAVACKGWRWMPGMLTDGGLRLTDTYPLYLEKGAPRFPMSDEHKWGLYLRESEDNPAILPDLTDPATVGCVLHLVRAAWGCPVEVRCLDGRFVVVSRDWSGLSSVSEGKALVESLEDACET